MTKVRTQYGVSTVDVTRDMTQPAGDENDLGRLEERFRSSKRC